MDTCITGADCNVFRYMINHRNSWISHESIMASSSVLVIEEIDPIGGDDSNFFLMMLPKIQNMMEKNILVMNLEYPVHNFNSTLIPCFLKDFIRQRHVINLIIVMNSSQ